MSISLRRATPQDAAEYLRIVKLVESPINHVASDLLEAQQALESSTTSFIEMNGSTVGLIAVQQKAPDHVYICEFAIDPSLQGQGIGGAALALLLEQFSDVPLIDLATHPENPAQKLYERNGFIRKKLVEDWEGCGPRLHFVLLRNFTQNRP